MPDRLMHEGQVLGNYRLVRSLGRGGFAEVCLARHVHLDRFAAIKLLYTQVDGPDVQRFKREARIVADLRHPHIVNILDFGVQDGRVPYLIMQYAPRGTLRGLYPRGSVLPPAEVLEYVTQVAQALDFAHSRHVIHRDVKPENMLLAEDDTLLLSDFGIATLFSESGRQVTPHVAGTSAYMAPEQLRGKPHPASDQYALGVVAYEWLCGERPFRGSFPEIAAQHLNATPPPLRTRNPRISPALEEVVHNALAKQPEQRYPTVGDFAADFRAALQSSDRVQYPAPPLPTRSTRRSLDTILVQPSSTPLSGTRRSPARPRSARDEQFAASRKRHVSRRALLLSLGGALALAGTGGTLAWLSTHHPALAPTSTTHSPAGAGRSVAKKAGSATSEPTSTPSPQASIGKILSFHTFASAVTSVNWLPKQMNVAAGCADNTTQIWYVDTNSVQAFQGFTNAVTSVTWSPDGKRLAAGSYDATVRVWDVTNGTHLLTCTGHSSRVYTVAWSPDGKYIASGSADNTVIIWNATNGNPIYTYQKHSNWVRSVAWSPNGNYIASGGHDGTVQVWSPTTKKTVYTFTRPGIVIYTVAWSPDGKRIASGNFEGTVDVWDALDGRNSYSYSQHSDSIFAVAWSPDGKRIASGSADTTVRVWDALDGGNTFNFRGHQGTVDGLSWSFDSTRIASASADKSVQLWQAI